MPGRTKLLNILLFLLLTMIWVCSDALPAFASLGNTGIFPSAQKNMIIRRGTAYIDGKPEFQWNILPGVEFGSDDIKVSMKAMWNKKTLYLYADVTDPTQSEDDCLELVICGDDEKTAGETNKFTIYRDGRADQGVTCIVTENERSYSVEAAVVLQKTVIPGDQTGLDVRAADANTWKALSWNNSGRTGSWELGTGTFDKELKAVYSLYGTPQIDGEMDTVWEDAAEIATNTWVQGIVGPAAQVRTLWDEKNLYLYAHVTDKLRESLWEKDSIELFVDRDNGKTKEFHAGDSHYRISFEDKPAFEKGANAIDFQSCIQPSSDGYIVEASIAWDAAMPLQDSLIGFDIQVNGDYNRDGITDSVVTWNDNTGLSDQSTEGYGVLRLVKAENLVFTDTNNIAWAQEQIEALGQKQIVGASVGKQFEPMKEITRADFLHYLINTLGLTCEAENSFDDVPDDAGYAKAIAIARKLGITNGVGNNQFLPLDGITRQDMMTLVVRALDVAGISYESADKTVIQSFTDVSLVSDYAAQSVAILVKNGIIQGSENRLNPRFNLTRAEAAVLLYRIYAGSL